MVIAVTGGTGFVGRHVVERLLRREHELRVLVREPARHGWLTDRGGVEVVQGDLSEQESLRVLVRGADSVVHLVGIIVEIGRQTFERVHAIGTRNVVAAAREAGVAKLVHMSALGARPDRGATAYHRTKASGEEAIRTSGMAHVIIRPSLIAAPGNEALRLMVDLLRFAPVVPVIGSGLYQLQPVAAGDVAEAFAVAVERPELTGSFDVAGAEQLTYHEVLDELERALGVGRRRIPVPVAMVRFAAYAGMVIPNLNPITPEQLHMLLEGNTTERNALPTTFGVTPTPFAEVAREICRPWAARAVPAGT